RNPFMLNRRSLLSAASLAAVSKAALAGLPEPVIQTSPDTQPPLQPPTGRPYNPVVTLNGWTAPWRRWPASRRTRGRSPNPC
ncbi:hypothetical protein, partial [Escherichia coli]|uniref:hypothetical protein n=1 Tax=Escherichia coli TaxID=562 RepID=UPI001BC8C5A3